MFRFGKKQVLREQKFVVILAVARSGSTLLQGVLNTLPGYLVRGENAGFVLQLCRGYHALRQAKQFVASKSKPTHPWFGAEHLSIESYLDDAAGMLVRQLAGQTPIQKLQAIGFKEIRWLPEHIGEFGLWNHLTFIEKMFPNAHFILLTRDVENTIRSGGWSRKDPHTSKMQITEFYNQARQAPVKRLLEVAYEDLVPDGPALKNIAEYLGQELAPAMNEVLKIRHSYDTSEANLRETELRELRARTAVHSDD